MFSARSVVRTGSFLLGLALLLGSGVLGDVGGGSPTDRTSPIPSDRLASVGLVPSFVENRGQVRTAEVAYTFLSDRLLAGFAPEVVGIVLTDTRSATATEDPSARILPAQVRRLLIRVAFDGSNPVAPVGLDERPGRSHYLLGDDPAGWRTGIRGFDRVTYASLYEGVDLAYRSDPSGLKYEFRVRPGADPDRIVLRYEGAEEIRVDPAGGLVIRTGLGTLQDSPPIAHAAGREIACPFALRGPQAVGFDCRGWDGLETLVIDPLLYSTLLGGADEDIARGIAVDGAGQAYVTGTTWSADFPTTPGVVEADLSGQTDVFVAKLNPGGTSLLYTTFLGGGGHEEGYAIAVDTDGNAFVTGYTTSPSFPTTPGAFDVSYNNNEDIFVAKLNPAGSNLVYSTFMGGVSVVYAYAVAVDAVGNAFVTGSTRAEDFPTTADAHDVTYNGEFDAFLTEFSPDGGQILYSTFFGALQDDVGLAVAVDAAGNVYVAGMTSSDSFPTSAGAYDPSFNGRSDAFVAKFGLGPPSGLPIFWIAGVAVGAAVLVVVLLVIARRGRRLPAGRKPSLPPKAR